MLGFLELPPLFCCKCGKKDVESMTFYKSNLICKECWVLVIRKIVRGENTNEWYFPEGFNSAINRDQ